MLALFSRFFVVAYLTRRLRANVNKYHRPPRTSSSGRESVPIQGKRNVASRGGLLFNPSGGGQCRAPCQGRPGHTPQRDGGGGRTGRDRETRCNECWLQKGLLVLADFKYSTGADRGRSKKPRKSICGRHCAQERQHAWKGGGLFALRLFAGAQRLEFASTTFVTDLQKYLLLSMVSRSESCGGEGAQIGIGQC